MTKDAVAKAITYHTWADGSKRSWAEPEGFVPPSWYPAVGEIVALGSNTLDTVVDADLVGTTGHIGTAFEVMANWSGGAVAYKGGEPYLFVYGGGHGSCSINGIYKFGPLTSDTPVWSIELPMSRTPGPQDAAYFSDGQPNTTHNYHQLAGNGDSMWLVGFDVVWWGGGDFNAVDRYDTTAGAWDGENAHPDVPRGGSIHGSTVYADGRVWYVGGNSSGGSHGVLSGGVWTQITPAVLFANYVASCYDSLRGRIVSYSAGVWQTIDITDNSTATGSTNALPTEAEVAASLEYDPDRDRYVRPAQNSLTVHELHPTTWQWAARTLTGVTPALGQAAGDYGRFGYVPELKGYIYAPAHDTQVYFYRSA